MAAIIENADQMLDQKLPAELRQLQQVAENGDQNKTESPNPSTEESEMSTPNTITPDQARQIASAEVEKALEAKDQQVQLASLIEKHVASANAATTKAENLQVAHDKLSTELNTVKTNLQKATDDLAAANKAKDETVAKLTESEKNVASLTKELAETKKKITASEVAVKVSERKTKITASKLKLENFTKLAAEVNEDGSLKMNDASFDSMLADYVANAPKEQASAEGEKKPEGTPVPPDLSAANEAARQAAALHSGGDNKRPTASQYAKAFGLRN